jgi:hypothetical protein
MGSSQYQIHAKTRPSHNAQLSGTELMIRLRMSMMASTAEWDPTTRGRDIPELNPRFDRDAIDRAV